LFGAMGAATWWIVDGLVAGDAWHGAIAGAAAGVLTVLALWLLFRAVAIAIVGLFADEIVVAVERRHYPAMLAGARGVPLHRAARMGLASALRFLVINLVLLPVYVGLMVTGIGTAAAFFVVNGWLLGRDLGDMVSARHLAPAAMREWRRAHQAQRFLLGLAVTGLFVVPFLNLLAPVIGAAMATHLFHRTRA
jgi:uncharacterized protein involved in cysteine biosynthesis